MLSAASASDSFEPVSVSAVPSSWRALYWSENKEGFTTLPMIGWAVWRVSVRGSVSDQELPQGQAIEGVVLLGSSGPLLCALELDYFMGYLSPEEPDPEPGKVDPKKRGRRPTRSVPGFQFAPATPQP